jgi:hypothetical protein
MMTFIIGHLAYMSLSYPALETIDLSGYHWAIRCRDEICDLSAYLYSFQIEN